MGYKITIEITNKSFNHLKAPHTFYDGCWEANRVLYKVQEEIEKIIDKSKKKKRKAGVCKR